MKRLTQHIISLLRLYDTVVVPEVGVYSLEYVPSRLDQTNSIIIPPKYVVKFERLSDDEEAGMPDTRLLDSYSRKERISPSDAKEILDRDINEFKNYISFGGNPVLEELGYLNPVLPSLRALPLSEVTQSPEDESREEVYTGDDSLDYPERSRRFNPAYYYIPVHKKVAKLAACIALVVIVGIAALIPITPSGNLPSNAAIIPIALEDKTSTAQKDTVVVPQEEIATVDVAPETETLTETTENKVEERVDSVAAPQDRYYAIVAAFTTEKEANKFIDASKRKSTAYNIIKNKRFYMISVASASEKADLEGNLPLIRAEYPDAWIFSMR